jgi:IS30 family transposase
MNDATTTSAMEGSSAAPNGMPLMLRKSMTYDQGQERARHVEIPQRTGVAIYFCDPPSSWLARQQREHQWTGPPKGTDLSVHSQEGLDAIALQLNMRPANASTSSALSKS